jgi:predicted nuclease of predicted toxin-antitoxin system
MRVLLDQSVPAPLKQHLPGHEIRTAHELGWSRLSNGDLIAAAEGKFEVLITADRNMRRQQSLAGRALAVLILPTTSWPKLQPRVAEIAAALVPAKPGQFTELPV